MTKTTHNPINNKEIRKKLRKTPTQAERFLWSKLKNKQLKHKFRRQYSIGNYIVDFYSVSLKLVIELDGISHLSNDTYKKDLQKQNFLETTGHIVKRYNDDDVINNIDRILLDLSIICSEIDNLKKNF